MPNSFNKIWIHAIWSTKCRQPFIHSNVENQIYHFMRQQFRDLGCPVQIINGMPDHVHCLFLLNPQKTITDVIKQIKGSTSHFINKNQLIPERFSWQDGFAAFSVSESIKERVFHYIENQKQHHAKQSSMIEFEQFLKLYGLVIENQ